MNKEILMKEYEEIECWLKQHDYIGIKIATGRANKEDYLEEIEEMNKKASRLEEILKEYEQMN